MDADQGELQHAGRAERVEPRLQPDGRDRAREESLLGGDYVTDPRREEHLRGDHPQVNEHQEADNVDGQVKKLCLNCDQDKDRTMGTPTRMDPPGWLGSKEREREEAEG